MRITDYRIGQTALRVESLRRRLHLSRQTGSVVRQIRILRMLREAEHDAEIRAMRSARISIVCFNLNSMSDEECLTNFRFRRSEVGLIARLVNWNHGRTERNRYKCTSVVAICILLRRLASLCRYRDIEPMFGMHASALCEVFWECSIFFHAKFGNLLTTFRADIINERAALYAECIRKRGAALPNCVGFMDGTKIRIARPGGHSTMQRSCYSGHKRMHCLVYQTVTTPDGLIFNMYGPIEGRQPDAFLYRESGIDPQLEQHLLINDVQYYLYADRAYVLRPWMQTAFAGLNLTEDQVVFNRSMNKVRTSVEWSYGEVKQHFTSQDFSRKLVLAKAPVGVLYILSVILRNFKTCLGHGGQCPSFYKCAPPTFDRYITMQDANQ